MRNCNRDFLGQIILLWLLFLAACATQCPPAQPQTRVIDSACAWVKPITAAAGDTADTKRQILAHDMAVRANCPDAGASP